MRERIQSELDIVRNEYGDLETGPDGDWLKIKNFKLPPGWNKEKVKLLILIPSGYPATPPDNFYVDNSLRLANGNLPGATSANKNKLGEPWLQFSYHVEKSDWSPHADILHGHNLLTFLKGAEERLSEVS